MVEYKLSCEVIGHEKDVRALHALPSAAEDKAASFISGSRDLSMRMWTHNSIGLGYHEDISVKPGTTYVSSVCFSPAHAGFPDGYVAVGCKDGTVKAFKTTGQDRSPLFSVKYHTDNVCSLDSTINGGLLSSSWDKTSVIMVNDTKIDTLKGHEAAVWSSKIITATGVIITASADKTIKLWKDAKCQNTLTGHTDCVRGVSLINDNEFLSCSNDSTVRRWFVDTGICSKVYYGHSNYVYSVAVLSASLFASCGEDRTVRVWSLDSGGAAPSPTASTTAGPPSQDSTGTPLQTITFPATSLWTLSAFDNGDFIVGSSDSMIRMFTTRESSIAPTDQLVAFDEAVSLSEISRPSEQVDASNLPPISTGLTTNGKKEGDVRMVNEGGVAIAFQWSNGQWLRIGKIVGANKNKTMFNGKEYDFVFDVDIADGAPTLKLPYNLDEDVWTASQRFLDANKLNPVYLEEVVNFVQARIRESGRTSTAAVPQSSYQDPFTGAGRYVPESSGSPAGAAGLQDPFTGSGRYVPDSSPSGNGDSGSLQDPFTGAGRYVPGSAETPVASLKPNEYFPVNTFLVFIEVKPDLISDKIQSFNKDVPQEVMIQLDIKTMCHDLCKGQVNAEYIKEIMQCLQYWPSEKTFPMLDLLRISCQYELTIDMLVCMDAFRQITKENLVKTTGPNCYLMLRCFCNMFSKESGRVYLANMLDELVKLIKQYLGTEKINKNMEIAISSLILNYAIMGMNKEMDLLIVMRELIIIIKNDEAKFRLLVALGTLILNSEIISSSIKGAGFAKFVQSCSEDICSSSKTSACAKYLVGFI